MVIMVEGPDNVGKGTQIQNIKDEFERRGKSVHILHYSNIKAFPKTDTENIKNMSFQQFRDMMKLCNFAADNDSMVLILDRAHLGEFVYSPLYRNYTGDYVFDIEKDYIYVDSLKNMKLILFTDKPENLIKRDDGLSFSVDPVIKTKELELFDKAFEKSIIDKKRIELNGRNINQIWNEEVMPFIFNK